MGMPGNIKTDQMNYRFKEIKDNINRKKNEEKNLVELEDKMQYF